MEFAVINDSTNVLAAEGCGFVNVNLNQSSGAFRMS
jgi:hypothetical protein